MTSVATRPAGQPGGVAPRPALARCVAVEPAKFAATYWGRAPLLSRAADLANPVGFTDLFDRDTADELLSRRGLRTPFIRVARDGAVLAESTYTGSGGAGAEIGDQVLDERVLGLYADGATIVLQGLHRLWPPIIDFTTELSAALCQPLQVNAYLTPAGNQGFATHYDTHDVFVLQVRGRKRWRVHAPVLADPLPRQTWSGRADEVAARADGPPALDVVLAPGDALYLPRGWLHSATAQHDSSLHLTVGVRSRTRFSLVEALLELAVDEPALRASVPMGVDLTDPSGVAPELTATVTALRDWLTQVTPTQLAAELRRRGRHVTRPAPLRPLEQADRLRTLDLDDVIRLRQGLSWRLVPQPPDRIAVEVFDRTVSFPAPCAPALRAVLHARRIRVGDLPGLADDDRVVLARRLLREAIAVVD
ncbi:MULTISPECIES: cupin domain-containing protein [unclassified Solwaraspora]|uniref:cupin domain-containing protein n=1 Tax=unclassified Solwaraspora TaxID=2627926 RepID=UPI00259B030D|nr:cupin domain-containing protein [Solwaraspora sp. WMMA2056]WJK39036.1 cupin domain-containing protein [Solwaraspora sp. WMMA2056]